MGNPPNNNKKKSTINVKQTNGIQTTSITTTNKKVTASNTANGIKAEA